jgi:hypothetical protein
MRVLVDVGEVGDQLEALIERAAGRGDRPLSGRSTGRAPHGADERPVAASGEAGIDALWDIAREGRGAAFGATPEHGGLYDEAGAPD